MAVSETEIVAARRRLMLVAAFLTAAVLASPGRADDRHVDYYYPRPQVIETYQARGETLPESDRTRRIGLWSG
jgi:hypothetical protein